MKKYIEVNNKNYKKNLRKVRRIRKYCDKNNTTLQVIFDEKINNNYKNTFKQIEKAINIKKLEKRYSYIYDLVCDYLDNKYFNENLCGFDENGVCEYYRKVDKNHYNGCCYRDDRSLCKYFDEKNSKCTERGISCKLYSCPTLREKGINYKMKDIPLIKYFFNIKQKYYIKYSFFKPKPFVIYKLMENKSEK